MLLCPLGCTETKLIPFLLLLRGVLGMDLAPQLSKLLDTLDSYSIERSASTPRGLTSHFYGFFSSFYLPLTYSS